MMDIKQQVSDVRRTVGSRVIEAGEANVVTLSQSYDADIGDVWDACTNPERIPRWFLPVSGELRLGGRYQLEGNAGGTIERCDPPTSFSATWEFGGGVTWIEVTLTSEPGGRTRLELAHIGMAGDEHWQQFGPGAVGVGWDMGLLGLAGHLGSGAAVDPADAPAWMASDDGKLFMTQASERWCEAHIAAGEAEEDARAAAGRTLAAYTGTAPAGDPG
jgi:uncharacterized protein YndB with AHSA1/START domain